MNRRAGLPRAALVTAALGAAALAGGALAAFAARATTAGTTIRVTEKDYAIVLARHSFKPGKATFVVTNRGATGHEFAVSGPRVRQRIRGTIEPGTSRTLTVTLRKGTYTLRCPLHTGMQTTIKVGGGAAGGGTTGGTSTTITDPYGGP